jgi:hypothetical protein
MDARKENKLTNYLTRKTFLDLDTSTAITATIPKLAAALVEWNGQVALIQVLGNKQGANLTGIAAAKADLRALMAKRAMIVRNKVGPFAHATGNMELAAQVDVNASDFTLARDTEADDIAIRILEAAQANEAALVADYGLKASLLDDLESAIEGYSALLGKPLAAIKSRKTTTEQLDTEFAKADTLLENVIDPLILSLELEQPDFVANYRNVMVIGGTPAPKDEEQPAAPAMA